MLVAMRGAWKGIGPLAWWVIAAAMQWSAVCPACTTAVISGRATPDGRPLLWKNRDISTVANEVVRLEDGKYPVVAVVNCGSRSSLWMGVNGEGLCIENSVTKDLAKPGSKGPGNGGFMLLVLQTCRSVEEVEALLKKTNESGRSTTACFGVIDAQGGAVIFETAPRSYKKFDANDPVTAPHGYVVRSNFSYTGQGCEAPPTKDQLKEVYSAGRYLRATELVDAAAPTGIDVKYLLRNLARDLADDEGTPVCGSVNGPSGELPASIPTANTISRTTTVSFAVFQGVKPGEDPALTTMWVGLGDPKFSVAVPCWVAAGTLPEELQGKKMSPLCDAAISLRKAYYSEADNAISTGGLQAIWTELWGMEDATLERVQQKLAAWRSGKIDQASMRALQVSAAEQALAALKGHVARVAEPAATAGE